ncbi:hypothetical protein OROHE_021755 [Orobanche hederae]
MRKRKELAPVVVGWVLALQWCVFYHRFTIHGLWPKIQGKRPKSRETKKLNVYRHLSVKLQHELKNCWPDVESNGKSKASERFWRTEWFSHGRFSGLTPEKYFQSAVDVYNRLPHHYKDLGLQLEVKTSIGDVTKSIKAKTNLNAQIKVIDGTYYIKELQFHLNQNLEFVDAPKMEPVKIAKSELQSKRSKSRKQKQNNNIGGSMSAPDGRSKSRKQKQNNVGGSSTPKPYGRSKSGKLQKQNVVGGGTSETDLTMENSSNKSKLRKAIDRKAYVRATRGWGNRGKFFWQMIIKNKLKKWSCSVFLVL